MTNATKTNSPKLGTLASIAAAILSTDAAAADNKGKAAAFAADALKRADFALDSVIAALIDSARNPETGGMMKAGELADTKTADDDAAQLIDGAETIKARGQACAAKFKKLVFNELLDACHDVENVKPSDALRNADAIALQIGITKPEKGADKRAYETLAKRLQRAWSIHHDAALKAAQVFTVQKSWRAECERVRYAANKAITERNANDVKIMVRDMLNAIEAVAATVGISPADFAGMIGGADVAAAVAASADEKARIAQIDAEKAQEISKKANKRRQEIGAAMKIA